MGKITLTVEGTTVGTVGNGGGVVVEYEVSEEDSARLVSAMAEHYAAAFQAKAPSGGEALPMTIGNIVKVWFDDVVNSALRLTTKIEARKLEVPPITVTSAE